MLLDEPDVALPLVAEAVPGLDHVVVAAGQVGGVVQYEGRGDALASAGCRGAGGVEADGHFDDLFDLPGHFLVLMFHIVFSCCACLPLSISIARRWVKAAARFLRSTRRAWP